MIIKKFSMGGMTISTSDETDGYGFDTVTEAVSVFNYFAEGRKFENALEWCCGPGYYGLGVWKTGLAKNVSFNDISPLALEVMESTFKDNNISFPFYLSDNFDNIPKQKFDLIVGNPPHFNFTIPNWKFGWEPGQISPHETRKMRDLDWKIHKKFYRQVGDYLTEDGSIMLLENMKGSSKETFQPIWDEHGYEQVKYFPSQVQDGYTYYIEVKRR